MYIHIHSGVAGCSDKKDAIAKVRLVLGQD